MRSTEDPWQNLALIQAYTEEAAQKGAQIICFPENAFYRGPKSKMPIDTILSLSGNRIIESQDFSKAIAEWTRDLKIAVCLGSVPEKSQDPRRPFNSHWFIQPGGSVSSYHKMHLFDFAGSQATYRESDEMTRGSDLVSVPFGDFKVGLSICFDLRFPELFRHLTLNHRTNLLLVPAAFTRETGRAHWHTLLRARAVENLSYVCGIGQWGGHLNEKGQELFCYGHSLIYSPWGDLVAEAGEEGDALLIVDLDVKQVKSTRERLPALDCALLMSPQS